MNWGGAGGDVMVCAVPACGTGAGCGSKESGLGSHRREKAGVCHAYTGNWWRRRPLSGMVKMAGMGGGLDHAAGWAGPWLHHVRESHPMHPSLSDPRPIPSPALDALGSRRQWCEGRAQPRGKSQRHSGLARPWASPKVGEKRGDYGEPWFEPWHHAGESRASRSRDIGCVMPIFIRGLMRRGVSRPSPAPARWDARQSSPPGSPGTER